MVFVVAVVGLVVLAIPVAAIAAPVVALNQRSRIQDFERRLARLESLVAATALVLHFLYTIMELRRLFQGPTIDVIAPGTGEAELWSYSLALLAVGIVALTIGLRRDLRLARLVSAVYIVAAVLKVFVVDLSSLQGVTRALSFIGLGLVLVGIGVAYQKLLRRPLPSEAAPVS